MRGGFGGTAEGFSFSKKRGFRRHFYICSPVPQKADFWQKLIQNQLFSFKIMDFKEIQELLRMVSRLNLGEVTIKEGDFKITVKSASGETVLVQPQAIAPVAAPVHAAAAPAPKTEAPAAPAPSTAAPAATDSKLVAIKSPMVGTFYRQPSPDKPAFAKVGDAVAVGQTVCIIEAMKLFNEIESEIKGTIVKVLVEDKSPVEYDQPLFLVEPA